ncbi:MAG: acylphosphatase [Bacteroidales bacterium]|nr:acylphosphatase [Bacteroidales bacterium]MBN2749551.1 acylphosphatase [Bacteroidales bacterium]
MKAVAITLYGKVQGVGFRYYVYRLAGEMGIRGFVKNQPDGSVYVEAEMDNADLEAFVDHCKIGPPRSVVSKCHVNSIPLQGFNSFSVC